MCQLMTGFTLLELSYSIVAMLYILKINTTFLVHGLCFRWICGIGNYINFTWWTGFKLILFYGSQQREIIVSVVMLINHAECWRCIFTKITRSRSHLLLVTLYRTLYVNVVFIWNIYLALQTPSVLPSL